jgi:hypothetical protein
MAEPLPPINVQATGEERSYRVTLEVDKSTDPANWQIIVDREVVYVDDEGNIVKQLRDPAEIQREFPGLKFMPQWTFTVAQAETIDPGIMNRVRNDIDVMVANAKAAI